MACGWSFNSTVQIIKYSNVDNFDKLRNMQEKLLFGKRLDIFKYKVDITGKNCWWNECTMR